MQKTASYMRISDWSSDVCSSDLKYGVKHFVLHRRNMGLARSFHDGIDYALSHGADIVVNTDGDNQYPQERIGDLVTPIIKGEAEIVIAEIGRAAGRERVWTQV